MAAMCTLNASHLEMLGAGALAELLIEVSASNRTIQRASAESIPWPPPCCCAREPMPAAGASVSWWSGEQTLSLRLRDPIAAEC